MNWRIHKSIVAPAKVRKPLAIVVCILDMVFVLIKLFFYVLDIIYWNISTFHLFHFIRKRAQVMDRQLRNHIKSKETLANLVTGGLSAGIKA